MSQNIRDKVLEAVEAGVFDADHLLLCCLKWMGDQDIHNMLRANECEFPSDDISDEDI